MKAIIETFNLIHDATQTNAIPVYLEFLSSHMSTKTRQMHATERETVSRLTSADADYRLEID